MLAYIGQCHCPATNLALEESLLQTLPEEHPGWFLLWQNAPSVIVGRHQCTVDEVNLPYATKHNIAVVRRISGGGAVYHDEGNLNFSIITHARGKKPDFAHFLTPVVRALRALGVHAVISGRNDLEVGGRKISGSSQRFSGGKVLHHGTLLVQTDMDVMSAVLSPESSKICAKGVASVRARVTNLADHWPTGTGMNDLQHALLREFATEQVSLPPEALQQAKILAKEKYEQWQWNFGASPPFDVERKQHFPWGGITLRLAMHAGKISQCRIFGDFFATRDIAELETSLIGCSWEPRALQEALLHVCWQDYFSGCHSQAMHDFFTATMPCQS